jgi:hypothetical protein
LDAQSDNKRAAVTEDTRIESRRRKEEQRLARVKARILEQLKAHGATNDKMIHPDVQRDMSKVVDLKRKLRCGGLATGGGGRPHRQTS